MHIFFATAEQDKDKYSMQNLYYTKACLHLILHTLCMNE